MGIFQLQNRTEIRQAIGYNLNDLILSEATSTTDTSSLIDTYGLVRGGDDEYNGRQVMIYDATGSIVDGEKSWVSDFASSTYDATVAPVFTAAITDGDKYEMWKTFTVEEINNFINQSIIEASTSGVLVDRQTDSNFTLSGDYEYDWLVPYAFGNDFKAVHKVEYLADLGTAHDIHTCEVDWDEQTVSGVTRALDTTYNLIEGSYCLKLTVAAGAATGILASDSITSLDISDCDEIEITIRSSVALTAGYIELHLDDTANCASGVETLDIPATLANTTTTHVIDLANPHLDTAIISVGINMATDVGAFTLYVDRIRAVKSASKRYEMLNPEHWFIVKGDTPKLGFTDSGLATVGENTQIRISGYSCPDIFSDDTTDSEIDPAWVIARTTGKLLVGHAKSSRLDITDRVTLSKYWLGEADRLWQFIRTKFLANTRWC